MSDPYFDYIERESQLSRQEQYRDMVGRFTPPPDPDIHKSVLAFDATADCDFCGAPIFPGDPVFEDHVTFQTGCSEEHCREAAKLKLATHS